MFFQGEIEWLHRHRTDGLAVTLRWAATPCANCRQRGCVEAVETAAADHLRCIHATRFIQFYPQHDFAGFPQSA